MPIFFLIFCTKRGNNTVNLVTSRKINTRLARPIHSILLFVFCCQINVLKLKKRIEIVFICIDLAYL